MLANHLKEEVRRLSSSQRPQESYGTMLRSTLGSLQRFRFEMPNTDTAEQLTASGEDVNEEAEHDNMQMETKASMIDVDLTDDLGSVNTIPTYSEIGHQKLLEHENDNVYTAAVNTFEEDGSNDGLIVHWDSFRNYSFRNKEENSGSHSFGLRCSSRNEK
eukprot:11918658-Ditylum_brightwellii.AAC.1